MAVLTNEQKAAVRRRIHDGGPALNGAFNRDTLSSAIQACENYFETTARAGFGSAIETAAPGLFTPAQKRRIVAMFLSFKREAEGF